MIHTANAVRTLQAVAITVGFAVFLWSTGLPTLVRFAEADSISSASDTLSDSAPNVVANHTIVFTTPNGLVPDQTILLTFPTGAGEFVFPGGLIEDDVDIDVGGTATSTQPGASGAGVWGVSTTTSTITLQAPSDTTVASSSVITIRIGDHAVDFGTGSNQITNPTNTGSHGIDIEGTMQDTGQVRVAIVDTVLVSASVDTSLTFTVNGTSDGYNFGSATTTSTSTTATTLPFETLVIETSETLAHNLTVATNATNGYTVTAQISGPFQSTLGDTIDGFSNGSDTNTPVTWEGPTGTLADADTYGHWGMTSSDTTAGRSSEFSADTWVAASTSPIVIMGHTGPADGTGSEGSADIGYQVEISALQEASDDYSTTLRYIATPTF
jgi:hypothetical protein